MNEDDIFICGVCGSPNAMGKVYCDNCGSVLRDRQI
jgi:predicted nucleic acid-binding Zn ribbon protein